MKLNCSIDEIEVLKSKKVKEVLDKDTKGEFQLLDVRQPREYESGHIPGAKLIPLGELEYRYGELDKDQGIISYCRTGHRSTAASILMRAGYTNVCCDVLGSMKAWQVSGFPIEIE